MKYIDETTLFNNIVYQRQVITESNINRLIKWLTTTDCGFITAFRKELKDIVSTNKTYLLKYPDIIESGGTKNSHTIKTHHNRVQGIQDLIARGLIIEPIRDLYKDEVRAIGKKLGLDDELVMRHLFPGPGLSINVLCNDGKSWTSKDDEELAAAKKELEEIKLDMFCAHCTQDLKRTVLPVRSVGVQGDFRTYRFPALLAFKDEGNGFYHFPGKREKIEECSSTITNAAKFLNRTCIKLYQKPSVKDEDLKLQEGFCDKRRLDQLREVDNIVLTEFHKSGW